MKYIYRVFNTINNKSYIGASQNPKNRFVHHMCYGNSLIAEDIYEHGRWNFRLEILIKCNDNLSDLYERKYIRKFNSYNNGYNLTVSGGMKGNKNALGHKQTEEHKRKVIEARKGKYHSKETKIKLSNATKKWHATQGFSELTKLKMSASQRKRHKIHGVSKSTRLKLSIVSKKQWARWRKENSSR